MKLPSLNATTRSSVRLFPCVGRDGWTLLVVVKQAYAVERGGLLQELGGATIRTGDEPWADGASSIRYPHDLAPGKATTDCIVLGDALTPGGVPLREMPVRVEIGDAALSAHAFGPRTWVDAGHAVVPTDPRTFTRAPLRWEHAFGGLDDSDPDRVVEEPRNPVGIGLVRDPRRLIGALAPHVERPDAPIRDHRSRPAPVGFGALGSSFEPRRSAAGTYDDAWKRDRMPMPPIDQEDGFHQVAAPELRSTGYLHGGETVRMLGLHPSGALAFDVPRRWFLVEAPAADGVQELVAVLDTVVLEPNALRCELVWRAAFPWPHRPSRRANVVRVRSLGDA